MNFVHIDVVNVANVTLLDLVGKVFSQGGESIIGWKIVLIKLNVVSMVILNLGKIKCCCQDSRRILGLTSDIRYWHH